MKIQFCQKIEEEFIILFNEKMGRIGGKKSESLEGMIKLFQVLDDDIFDFIRRPSTTIDNVKKLLEDIKIDIDS